MPYFGDVSGDLRGLLSGDSEYCVVAIVGGEEIDCQRCAKRAVRRVQNLDEAKWNELKKVEKRRFFDCFSENHSDLHFGVAVITLDRLRSMDYSHRLYHRDLDVPWDIALRGYAYSEIVINIEGPETSCSMYLDRFASSKQCEKMVDIAAEQLPNATIQYSHSKQRQGIQAADCLAGGMREHLASDEEWLSQLEDLDIDDCADWALSHLEHQLSEK